MRKLSQRGGVTWPLRPLSAAASERKLANHRVASQDRSLSEPPPTAIANQHDNSVPPTGEDSLAVTDDAAGQHPLTRNRWVLWLTMGLFASLAGNLFFGWVAWDTHARYQDLVDDMHESENRLDKQRRPPRDENLRTAAGSREFSYSGTDNSNDVRRESLSVETNRRPRMSAYLVSARPRQGWQSTWWVCLFAKSARLLYLRRFEDLCSKFDLP